MNEAQRSKLEEVIALSRFGYPPSIFGRGRHEASHA